MNRKQKIIVSITGIVLVSLILIGLTYAYFLTKITGNTNTKSISVSTANLVLEYGENTNVVQGISNAEPGYSVEKIFTATNKGNSTVTYGAALESIVNGLTRQEDLVYTLTCTSYLKEGFSLASNGTITGTVDGTCSGVRTEKQFPSTSTMSVMTTNTIDTTHTHAYKLTVTYKEMGIDQSTDMNKAFSAKVNIVDLTKLTVDNQYSDNKKSLAYNIIENARTSANGTVYTPNISAESMVGKYVSNNDKLLSTAVDDIGISYYFRGNPIDTYVNYAGMCWNIVRIEGDGSVKIALASEKNCSTSNLSTTSGFATDGVAGVQGTALSAHYGYKIVDSKKINDYINSAADATENVRTKLNEWLERKITNESDKSLLKNDTWCIGDLTNGYDKSGNIKGNISDLINKLDFSSSTNDFRFAPGNRYDVTKTPTYKCETTGVEGEKDINKVGLLTIDELVYAGESGNEIYKHYLINNLINDNGYNWIIMSPRETMVGSIMVFQITYDDLVASCHPNGKSAFNPVVTLKSNTQITGGDGTISNPYILQ